MEFNLNRQRIDAVSEQKLFEEMERIWRQFGHRPSRTEWEASDASIHYNTYRRRFGGWVNACAKFVEFKMGGSLNLTTQEAIESAKLIPEEKKRQIPLRLRLRVLDRDNYKCVLCGKTPVLIHGTVLHIDHRVPFAHGGKTALENLQTLCAECNLGKGAFAVSNES